MSHMADAVLAGRKNIVAKNEGADGKPGAPKGKTKPAAEATPDKDAEAEAAAEKPAEKPAETEAAS